MACFTVSHSVTTFSAQSRHFSRIKCKLSLTWLSYVLVKFYYPFQHDIFAVLENTQVSDACKNPSLWENAWWSPWYSNKLPFATFFSLNSTTYLCLFASTQSHKKFISFALSVVLKITFLSHFRRRFYLSLSFGCFWPVAMLEIESTDVTPKLIGQWSHAVKPTHDR